MDINDIKTIAVIGAGNMGHQVSLHAAISGFNTVCTDVNAETLAKAEKFVETYLAGRVEKQKLTQAQADAAKANIRFTGDLRDAVRALITENPKAPITLNRVYRFLAVRLHPDNPKTGDLDQFLLLKQAYDVLSDPQRRAEYDANRDVSDHEPIVGDQLCNWVDFMDDIDGELNRRLAVLGLLYIQRRTNPYNPEVSLMTLEQSMGFPRDYLDFTTWYLKSKEFITKADNATFTLTVHGVDFVESNREKIPVLKRLLTGPTTEDSVADVGPTPPNIRPDVWHHPGPLGSH